MSEESARYVIVLEGPQGYTHSKLKREAEIEGLPVSFRITSITSIDPHRTTNYDEKGDPIIE